MLTFYFLLLCVIVFRNFQNGGQHQKRFGSPSGHTSQEQLRLAYLRQQQQQKLQEQHESVLQSQNGYGQHAGDDFFASAADGLQYLEDDIEGRLSSLETIKTIIF